MSTIDEQIAILQAFKEGKDIEQWLTPAQVRKIIKKK